MTGKKRAVRWTRRHEAGMTLVDLIVSWIIGLVILTSMGAAFSIALLVRGHGGAVDRTAGAHDQMTFEQYVSQDLARASCIQKWSGSPATSTTLGSCAAAYTKVPCPSGTFLCVGWPVIDSITATNDACHAAVYSVASGAVTRTEYAVPYGASSATTVSATDVTSGRASTSSHVNPSIVLTTVASPSGGLWVSLATVQVNPTDITKNVTPGTLDLRPVTLDPAGASSMVGFGGTLIC